MVVPRFAGDVTALEFIHPGDLFTYTITLCNEGCQAGDPRMEDALPAEVELITVTAGAWYSETAHTVYWRAASHSPAARSAPSWSWCRPITIYGPAQRGTTWFGSPVRRMWKPACTPGRLSSPASGSSTGCTYLYFPGP